MKKFLLACSGAFLLAAACAQSGPGGSTPGSGGSSSGAAGTTGAGGNDSGSGGSTNPGTAGDNSGSAGSTNPGTAGSSSGSAGSTNPGTAGDNSGSAGSNQGSAGSNQGAAGSVSTGGRGGNSAGGTTGGSAAGTGGSAAGATGTAGRGGSGGTAGTTGTGGTGGTGGAACPTIADLIPGLDGYLWKVLPSGTTPLSGTNYPFGDPSGAACPQTSSWTTSGYIKTETPLAIKGTTGKKYTIHINVRGVVGTRCYTGGTPGSTAAGSPNGQNNTWYAGGSQFNNSIWNTMEIRVAPKVTGEMNQTANSGYDIYFTNSFQNLNQFCEKEATYETRFNAAFPVMGGGSITFAVHDSNCRTLANCGAVEQQTTCNTSASRVIDMSGTNPAPVNFSQPPTGSANGQTYQIQWEWIDVTSVDCN